MRLTDLDARWALSGEPAAYDDNGGGCPGYQPRHDDLTVTGAAASEFTGKGTFFRSQVAVLRSAGMAVTDWDRSFGVPGFLPCLRAKVIREFAGRDRGHAGRAEGQSCSQRVNDELFSTGSLCVRPPQGRPRLDAMSCESQFHPLSPMSQ